MAINLKCADKRFGVLRRCVTGGALVVAVVMGASLAPTTSLAAPIGFAPADYDNNASQTTGVFRDVLNGAYISQGSDLGGTGHTALNFTGSDNNDPLKGRITLYDTSPSTTVPTLFSGNISISADILIHAHDNNKGAGILFLFNEGAGQNGLALHLWNAGNTDSNKIELVAQTGEARPGAALMTVALPVSSIADDKWYKLQMDLVFSGSNFTVTGKVFGHTTDTDPNSALGSQIGSTLTYNSSLGTNAIASPYEIGLVARGDGAVVDTSVTNYSIGGPAAELQLAGTPLPGAVWLFGTVLAAGAGYGRWRKKRKAANTSA